MRRRRKWSIRWGRGDEENGTKGREGGGGSDGIRILVFNESRCIKARVKGFYL